MSLNAQINQVLQWIQYLTFCTETLNTATISRMHLRALKYNIYKHKLTNSVKPYIFISIFELFIDNDECNGEGSSHNCDVHAVCTNTDGGFTCECNDGWSGDGVSCVGKP